MEKLFELALRKKYRYNYKGVISVEALWDLSTKDLDVIYRGLSAEMKDAGESAGLLIEVTAENQEIKNKMEIVKYIFDAKVAERKEKENAAAERQYTKRIEELIAQKKDANLAEKSIEELEQMLKK